jgi:ribosomal protein L11 methyltransferase
MENAKLNRLEDRIQVVESDLLSVLKQGEQFKLDVKLPVRVVVANILAEIILLFIEDVYEALQPGGYYIASGIYKNKEQIVQEALVTAGFDIEKTAREEDWVAFVARKR